jgi:ribonuclease P protein component
MAAPPPTLKRRRDFLACARGRRWAASGLVLQARRRGDGEAAEAGIRVGYTCSKKIGGAVVRNRAKRRLRAAAAEVLPDQGIPGWDYVLVGRPEATVARPFPELLDDLRTALGRVHAPGNVRA